MRWLIFVLFIPLMISCGSVETVIIYKWKIPTFQCPVRVQGTWDQYSVEKTKKENMLVEPNNIDMAIRLLENREHIIQCYERNLRMYEKENKKIEEK